MMGARRAFLASAASASAVCLFPRLARAVTAVVVPVAAGDRRFSVLYKGEKIGTHTVLSSSATGETRIETDIQLAVKVAFITLFAYRHRSAETWRDGRLTTLESETLEHGETLRVQGAATAAGFRVVSKGGPFIAPAATLTSNSLWTPAVLERATLVDAQHGGIIGVSARKLADEPIEVGGRRVSAARYSFITPYLAGSIWYDEESLWVRGAFERDGAAIEYRLDS